MDKEGKRMEGQERENEEERFLDKGEGGGIGMRREKEENRDV